MLKYISDDIWKFAKDKDLIVVQTTLSHRKDGSAIFPWEISIQCSIIYPNLEEIYGEQIVKYKNDTPVLQFGKLIMFPTVKYNEKFPHLGWKNYADLEIMERSYSQLNQVETEEGGRILVPLIGAGYLGGRLKRKVAVDLMDEHLKKDHYIVVDNMIDKIKWYR
jgi:hypothetical protein